VPLMTLEEVAKAILWHPRYSTLSASLQALPDPFWLFEEGLPAPTLGNLITYSEREISEWLHREELYPSLVDDIQVALRSLGLKLRRDDPFYVEVMGKGYLKLVSISMQITTDKLDSATPFWTRWSAKKGASCLHNTNLNYRILFDVDGLHLGHSKLRRPLA
jgi:hypothetical protein